MFGYFLDIFIYFSSMEQFRIRGRFAKRSSGLTTPHSVNKKTVQEAKRSKTVETCSLPKCEINVNDKLNDECVNIVIDHNYCGFLNNASNEGLPIKKYNSWREGRRIMELGVLLDNLRFCSNCDLGPVLLLPDTIVGEKQMGLGGYLYVQCQYCKHLNRAAYGKTHMVESGKGRTSFAVNSKLGARKY